VYPGTKNLISIGYMTAPNFFNSSHFAPDIKELLSYFSCLSPKAACHTPADINKKVNWSNFLIINEYNSSATQVF